MCVCVCVFLWWKTVPVVNRAIVRYYFTTTGGDICFKANFKAQSEKDFEVSTILGERTREQSHKKEIMVYSKS